MTTLPNGGDGLPSLSREFDSAEINMGLTSCGLLPERAEELVRLYREHGTWNEVREVWFDERRANRSTKGSSQKIYQGLTSRFKNAPAALPNPRDLPVVLGACSTPQDKAQVLYPYLVADDSLVRYLVHEYTQRFSVESSREIDFSNETIMTVLDQFQYADGAVLGYADSTTERWCEGFRSVMRKVGVLESQQTFAGKPPSIGKIPLLVAMGYSYEAGAQNWFESPTGLQYLFQPNERWEELYDRAAATDAWEFIELHGSLQLRPTEEPYSWVSQEGEK